ncbi:MAG: DNA translocase FtsK 4TM domain-containing protein [Chlamydiae bacterium]|nr:DNA translocase FtsK 4TM domain-containing protein [Chlamydiota bacterium]
MSKSADHKKKVTHPEAKGLCLIAGSCVTLLSLISFTLHGPSSNLLGLIGYGIAWGLNITFGLTSYLVCYYMLWSGWKLLSEESILHLKTKTIYFSIFIFSLSILLNLLAELHFPFPLALTHKVYSESVLFDLPYPHACVRRNMGGVPAYFLYRDLPNFNLQRMLSDVGVGITFSIACFTSFLLTTEIRILPLIQKTIKKVQQWQAYLKDKRIARRQKLHLPFEPDLQNIDEMEKSLTQPIPQPLYNKANKKPEMKIKTTADEETSYGTPIKKEVSEIQSSAKKKLMAIAAQKVYNGDFSGYQLPPPSLLTNAQKIDQPSLKKELKRQAEILEETLMSFGIEAKVGDINSGPTITSFEVHPAIGVKVQKIKALENDIALNLQAKSIRIIAPIPGKAAVGVEVPSLCPQEVGFKEMLIAYQQQKKLNVPVLLGKSVNGDNVISDLAKMPHCIIAGATGSGKSVCINTLVMSIVMNARPDEIKLVLIDPKKVELSAYTKLPHLIAPVITEAHGAYAALQWLVKEMETRYEILRQLGLRNINAFNTRVPNQELESSLSLPIPAKMATIVAIIDEFADLMMVSSSDLETPIARIAQMARAVGIHLILATQRPSREVITGLIKANFPTRISFKVASRINSQIILDDTGAESLLGNGDMLFLPPGSSQLIRAQGAYISDEDINKVIAFICDQAPTNYLIASFDKMKKENGLDELDEPRDSMYDQARSIVTETNNASTTFLQRKLKIGYARAASLMDELEQKGVIGPQEGSKPRRILIEASPLDKKGVFPQFEESARENI